MRVINKIKSNKKGFTLLELMLAIAIMMITMESIFSLIITTYNSQREVSYMNSCTDLLELNSEAIEAEILAFTGSSDTALNIGVDGVTATKNGNTPLFNLSSIKTRTGADKFAIELRATLPEGSKEVIQYTITVKDLENGGKYGSITNSVWLPHSDGKITIGGGSTIKLEKVA